MKLLLLSLAGFLTYNIITWIIIGVKSSISDTVNYIKYPIFFRLFIFTITVPMLFYGAKTSIGIMIAASLISWVGFAHTVRGQATSTEYKNHGIGALGGILAAYLTFAFEGLINKDAIHTVDWSNWLHDIYFWAIVAFLISAVIILPIKILKKKGIPHHTTWIETSALLLFMLPIIIHLSIIKL